MNKWICAVSLIIGFGINAQADECKFAPPAAITHTPAPINSQRLVLAGPNKLELGLGQTPVTLAQSKDMLIARYSNGATFSSRQLSLSEVRSGAESTLSLPDFIRLVFQGDVPKASTEDNQEAQAIRAGLKLGCSHPSYREVDGVEVFAYTQTRTGGERYHGYYILDGSIVHYIDISATDAFANQIISTLHKRN